MNTTGLRSIVSRSIDSDDENETDDREDDKDCCDDENADEVKMVIDDDVAESCGTTAVAVTNIPIEDSYLPSWVLKMRYKIEESRLEHAKAESRIDSLQVSISNLDINLVTLRSSIRTNNAKDTNIESSGSGSGAASYSFKIYRLPSDVVSEVLDFLSVDQIVRLECVSSSFRNCTAECPFWARNLRIYCPHIVISSIIGINQRAEIIRHVEQSNRCVEFIRAMKNQRCIHRQNSIEPHRHSKNERDVTHPLPVFESSLKRGRSTSLASITNGGGDMIMSRTETLNSDFRSIAHRTLEVMFHITTCTADPLQERLASEGAVTVLISLLSNEAGVLQHFSCGVLANLLCWECSRNELISTETEVDLELEVDNPPSSSETKMTPLAQQLRACGGQALLIALLTSPSASVNLSGTTGRVSGGLKEIRMTASVQVVCVFEFLVLFPFTLSVYSRA